MSFGLPATTAEDAIHQPGRVQFEAFLDEHRGALNGCLDGLTEEQVRRSLVPSRTTLLGLVKRAAFVEKVWFDEAVTCRSRDEIAIPATPDESVILDEDDTIVTVRARRGPIPLRWVSSVHSGSVDRSRRSAGPVIFSAGPSAR